MRSNQTKIKDMSWQKKESDPTAAFMKNNREQRLLELHLEEIEKLWGAQLKLMKRERLEATLELAKLLETRRRLEHYQGGMTVEEMAKFTDCNSQQMKNQLKEQLSREKYDFEEQIKRKIINQRLLKESVHLPRFEEDLALAHRLRHNDSVSECLSRRGSYQRSTPQLVNKSFLKESRLLSVSDPDLRRTSKFPQIDRKNSEVRKTPDMTSPQNGGKYSFPALRTKPQFNDDYRYLKYRMATALDLPPVQEVVHQRKLSI